MQASSIEKIAALQRCPANIRNLCILAHVDHGKTTLADTLVASNGIISQRMAGKLRYMDSREDEQLRGITMKSSAISLRYNTDGKEYLINLIDSPGHVDFSSEVSTAVRLCDGAIVLVDVVEGVCPQTHAVLRQAWLEDIRPVLVLNKLDRLFTELKLTPLEAHQHLRNLLQQVNAITGQLFLLQNMDDVKLDGISKDKVAEDKVYDWSIGLENTDDSSLYFSPDQGNVVFASAYDGWGFGINHFAELYASKLGVNASVLRKTLWGDFYLEVKTKKVRKGAYDKGKKPLFVQFVLENLWSVYEAVLVNRDKEKTDKIVSSLKLKIAPRDSRHSDPRVHLQAICSQWLPLSQAVLAMVVSQLPSPDQMTAERVEKLLCPRDHQFSSLPAATQALKDRFLACSASDEEPVILFVSKMVGMPRKMLPQHRSRPLSQEELNKRREEARKRHAQRLAHGNGGAVENGTKETSEELDKENKPPQFVQLIAEEEEDTLDPEEQVFVAFARIFSGTLRRGQTLYVLGPKHNPATALQQLSETGQVVVGQSIDSLPAGCHITQVTTDDLYLLMGRELESLEEIPAGNVLGIGGLEDHVLKSATLSDTVACPAFTGMHFEASPIVRVAIEPKHPGDMSRLVRGMRLLSQADPCAEVYVQQTGEHVLATAGEVHLHKCLDDLRDSFAKVQVTVSSPIVPFRETVVLPPKVDTVNEEITDLNQRMDMASRPLIADAEVLPNKAVCVRTPNGMCTLIVRACQLPPGIVSLLEDNAEIIGTLDKYFAARNDSVENLGKLSQDACDALLDLKQKMDTIFKESGKKWKGAIDQIWAFGPKGNGPNILLNRVPGYERPSIWSCLEDSPSGLRMFDHCVVSGFQMSSLAGPLCQEPMMGVCFVVEDWSMDASLTRRRQQSECSETGSALGDEEEVSLAEAEAITEAALQEMIAAGDKEEPNAVKPGETEHPQNDGTTSDSNIELVSSESQDNSCNQNSHNDESKTDSQPAYDTNNDKATKDMKSVRIAVSAVPSMSSKRAAYGPFSGQLMSSMKLCCSQAFQVQPQRLMAAMYQCTVQTTGDTLGKLYAVLGRYSGRVLSDDMHGTSFFNIKAVIPVIESFGFAEEIRKRTSGLASPQLKFSHWEIIDLDPYWVPSTDEEYLHYGEKADYENSACRYMNSVRRRKGLKVDEKIVEFAEKQRTLTRNK